MKCSIFQEARAGKRPCNQDRLGHWQSGESLLLVVADGVGGHAHGEIAAQIAVDSIASAPLEKDDIVLLCSDGFWGPLTERQILVGLIGREASGALPELIALAEARAGEQCDNVSVVATQWHEIESTQATQ